VRRLCASLTGIVALRYPEEVMRALAVRAVCLTLALLIATAGVLPCVCSQKGAAGTGGGHCSRTDSGLWASAEGCTCVCMTPQAGEAAAPRSEPALARTMSFPPATHCTAPGPCVLLPRVAADRSEESPPPFPPLILRI